MKPDDRFLRQPKAFWAAVRMISEHLGYTDRQNQQIKTPTIGEMTAAFESLGLSLGYLVNSKGRATARGTTLVEYFAYRATILNQIVEPSLMKKSEAARRYNELRSKLKPKCPLPLNKQKGKKRGPAYLTGIVNMLIESSSAGAACNYDPRKLTTVTREGAPIRTLARRVDGAFPDTVNPIAIWEIKEYYNTTTFGSRVADGVYESLLDGMELEELREHEDIDVKHYLIVDDHYTWWECGRSYLCRIIDMLHMGYLDEVLFGREVLEKLPALVKEWVRVAKARDLRLGHDCPES